VSTQPFILELLSWHRKRNGAEWEAKSRQEKRERAKTAGVFKGCREKFDEKRGDIKCPEYRERFREKPDEKGNNRDEPTT